MSYVPTAVIAALGLGACALMATSQHGPDEQPQANASVVQGMTAVRDAESNTWRAATPEEAARLGSGVVPKVGATLIVRRADGSKSARLDDSHMVYTTVSRDTQGRWVQACSMNHDHAAHSPVAAVREVQ